MVEEEKPKSEEEKPEEVKKDLSLIEKAEEAATRIEKANVEMQELIQKQEKLITHEVLAGKSEAGKPAEEKKEESPVEYAERIKKSKWSDLVK